MSILDKILERLNRKKNDKIKSQEEKNKIEKIKQFSSIGAINSNLMSLDMDNFDSKNFILDILKGNAIYDKSGDRKNLFNEASSVKIALSKLSQIQTEDSEPYFELEKKETIVNFVEEYGNSLSMKGNTKKNYFGRKYTTDVELHNLTVAMNQLDLDENRDYDVFEDTFYKLKDDKNAVNYLINNTNSDLMELMSANSEKGIFILSHAALNAENDSLATKSIVDIGTSNDREKANNALLDIIISEDLEDEHKEDLAFLYIDEDFIAEKIAMYEEAASHKGPGSKAVITPEGGRMVFSSPEKANKVLDKLDKIMMRDNNSSRDRSKTQEVLDKLNIISVGNKNNSEEVFERKPKENSTIRKKPGATI